MFGVSNSWGASSSKSQSYVDPAQAPFLDFLRNTAASLARSTGPGAAQFSQQAGQQLFGQGQQFLGQLMNNPSMAALQQQAGGNPALVDRQIGQLQADLGRSFNQQVLPGIRRYSGAIGALGGSRQGVAEGLAAQGFSDAFARGATDIYTQDAQRSLQAAVSGAGIASNAALGGLSALPGLFDVGMGQFTGQFAPIGLANQIIGPPVVLDSSRSRSWNQAGSFGMSGG